MIEDHDELVNMETDYGLAMKDLAVTKLGEIAEFDRRRLPGPISVSARTMSLASYSADRLRPGDGGIIYCVAADDGHDDAMGTCIAPWQVFYGQPISPSGLPTGGRRKLQLSETAEIVLNKVLDYLPDKEPPQAGN